MSTLALDHSADFDGLVAHHAQPRFVSSDALVSTSLHPAVLRIAFAAYALMVATFWIGFVTTGPLAVAMVIVTVCLLAYAGTPWLMSVEGAKFKARHGNAAAEAPTFRRFLVGHFETGAGDVSGVEALILVVTVPVCLLVASIVFAIIYNALA